MDNYFELKIAISPEIEDIVSDICFTHLDCEGVVLAEETYKDLVMTATTEGTLRVFLTDIDKNPIEILKTERELLKSRGFTDEELGSWEITLDEKENQDWSKKWKEKWTVTHVTDNIAVVPSWLNYEPKENEITITLDPGCAFGTGTHQTTQLCMKALEKYLKKGDSMADIGTGSGILAVLAMKLGASSAYGCDNDETVIDVAKENAIKNGLQVQNPPLATLPRKMIEYHFSRGQSKSLISGWGEFNHKYTQQAKQNAKELRNNATLQEKKLWQYLKNSQLLGYKFRRQQPINNYIVDFFCPELRLIIELDGGHHNEEENINYDKKRSEHLENQGLTVIRVWNNEIDNNIYGVIEYIKNEMQKLIKQDKWIYPTPTSKMLTLPQGEGNQPLVFELNTADKLTEKYDFVCANILHNVLYEIMGDLKNIMKDDGILSLSGILNEKKDIVLEAIRRENLKIIDTIEQDQWISYVVTK